MSFNLTNVGELNSKGLYLSIKKEFKQSLSLFMPEEYTSNMAVSRPGRATTAKK